MRCIIGLGLHTQKTNELWWWCSFRLLIDCMSLFSFLWCNTDQIIVWSTVAEWSQRCMHILGALLVLSLLYKCPHFLYCICGKIFNSYMKCYSLSLVNTDMHEFVQIIYPLTSGRNLPVCNLFSLAHKICMCKFVFRFVSVRIQFTFPLVRQAFPSLCGVG